METVRGPVKGEAVSPKYVCIDKVLFFSQMAALYSELAAKQVQARIQKNLGAKVGKMEYDSDEDTEDGTWEHKVSFSTSTCNM